MRLSDAPHDGKSQTTALTVIWVPRRKRSKIRCHVCRGAMPRVAHPQSGAFVEPGAERDHVPVLGMSHGVDPQLQHRLRDPLRVDLNQALGLLVDQPVPGPRPRILLTRVSASTPISVRTTEEVRPPGLGEQRQLLH